MASTYSTRGRLEKQGSGENENTWGDKTNTNLDLIDEWIGGHISISVAGSTDVTLTANNATSDQSRQRTIALTGVLTGNINVIVPTAENLWTFYNNTSGSFTLTVKTSAGTGVAIPQGYYVTLFCDGTNVVQPSPEYLNTALLANTGLRVLDTNASHYVNIVPGTNVTANRTWTITLPDADTTFTYATGTFTPGISFGGGTTGITYASQNGKYTRIGDIVFFAISISLSNKGSSTGIARITGLPITSAATTRNPTWDMSVSNLDLNVGGGYYKAMFQIDDGGTTGQILEIGDNVGIASITEADFANNTIILVAGFYHV